MFCFNQQPGSLPSKGKPRVLTLLSSSVIPWVVPWVVLVSSASIQLWLEKLIFRYSLDISGRQQYKQNKCRRGFTLGDIRNGLSTGRAFHSLAVQTNNDCLVCWMKYCHALTDRLTRVAYMQTLSSSSTATETIRGNSKMILMLWKMGWFMAVEFEYF